MYTDVSVRFLLKVENFDDTRIRKRYLLFWFFSNISIFSFLSCMFTVVCIISLSLSCPVINVLDPNCLSPKIPCERASARCGGSANHAAFYKVRENDIYTPCRSMRKKKEELKYLVCESITIEYELQSLTILFSVRKVEKLSKGRKQMMCKGSLLEHLIVVSAMFG